MSYSKFSLKLTAIRKKVSNRVRNYLNGVLNYINRVRNHLNGVRNYLNGVLNYINRVRNYLNGVIQRGKRGSEPLKWGHTTW